MSDAPATPLDPTLFAESPARDHRFTVKERWVDCVNLPADHPMRLHEFLHRQMNEEIDSLECSAKSLCDFPEADWELRMSLARQCSDEARHAVMFRGLFEQRGGTVGQYPVLNFQYRIISNIQTLIGRLTVQNRSFEAGGLDAISYAIGEARSQGDPELAELHEAQMADEIMHVRFANEWIHAQIQKDRRSLLHLATAMAAAERAFFQVMGNEGTEGMKFAADQQGRLEAGFSPDEIKLADELASASPASKSGESPTATSH